MIAQRSAASLRLDVQVGHIARSVIIKRKEDDAAVLVATSGERPYTKSAWLTWCGKPDPA